MKSRTDLGTIAFASEFTPAVRVEEMRPKPGQQHALLNQWNAGKISVALREANYYCILRPAHAHLVHPLFNQLLRPLEHLLGFTSFSFLKD